MIMNIKKKWIKILFITSTIITITYFIYNTFYNINNIPDGQLIAETSSPNKNYILKTYLINGGSLSANAIRVELCDTSSKIVKNIYFDYPKNEAKIIWLDETHIEINDIKLNILNDKYDWRKK